MTSPQSGSIITDGGKQHFYWFGFQHAGDFVANEPWSIFVSRMSGSIRTEHVSFAGACATYCESPDRMQTSASRLYRIDRTENGVSFLYDDGTFVEEPDGLGDMSIMIRSSLKDSGLLSVWSG